MPALVERLSSPAHSRAQLSLRSETLIIIVAVFLAAFTNLAFFRNAHRAFRDDPQLWLHLASVAAVLGCALVLLLAITAIGRALRPVLTLLLLVAAVSAYFMDTYNVFVGDGMIQNILETNYQETLDVLTPRLFAYVTVLGLLPAWFVWRTPVHCAPGWRHRLRRRMLLIAAALATAVAVVLPLGDFYRSLVHEHGRLRFYTNPLTPVSSALRYLSGPRRARAADAPLIAVGRDVRAPAVDERRELLVLVVGETARADRFGINDYARDTTPELARRDVVSFTNVHACGTSTAVSVPCMFSGLGQRNYDAELAANRENLLDVLKHAGVAVLWRDNNSDSKGVADRVEFQSFREPDVNPVCDVECRDEGMLHELDQWVDAQGGQDVLIVLHSMGSHGPAYYKRYPPAFERFTPVCETNQLDECSNGQIGNTYDNTIAYTDHFLAQVIDWLKPKSDRFETAMLYLSDHGESLGENGVYLHGLPFEFAPQAQTRVPAILWLGPSVDGVDAAAVRAARHEPYSHDSLFHTVLGFFELDTSVYEPKLDMLRYADDEPTRAHLREMRQAMAGAP
ncbi:MAG: phosphoethanolamine--lipid A transferase [Chromatiales bacterium]|nr:phosphoethanolamine--lipid A transferase [Chromatiales bacterium]